MNYVIRKILLPLDLSETSLNALETAAVLAERNDAQLLVLHVHETIPDCTDDKLSSLFASQAQSDVLAAIISGLEHRCSARPELIQETGPVVETIIRMAMQHTVDVVVMGTHGASGYRSEFIGTTCYGVLKHASCPVLTIPAKRKFTGLQRVLFPVRPVTGALLRFDIASRFMAPGVAMDVLGLSNQRFERETTVLHKLVNEIREKLEENHVHVYPVWGGGNSIAEDVLAFIHENQPGLVVLTPVIDFNTKLNFIGPHAQMILHHCRVPLLHIKKATVPMFA